MKIQLDGTTKYEVLYADPPWNYHRGPINNGTTITSDIHTHYPTMEQDELENMADTINKIAAPDSVLYMWATGPHLANAIQLGQAWGYKYKQVAYVWDKQQGVPGFYTFTSVEFCLVFTRGRVKKVITNRKTKQFHSVRRTRHSEKPHSIRKAIEQATPNMNRVELFARQEHAGWAVWGNEV